MKKFQFLLLDAGPIIKLFELGIWDKFIELCDVTISKTVVQQECLYYEEDGARYDIDFPFEQSAQKGQIKIIEVNSSESKQEIGKLNNLNYDIHAGEMESITFLLRSPQDYIICAADGAVFRFLAYIGKKEKGISLEEILSKIGLDCQLEWRFTKKFQKKYTFIGETDRIQRANP